MLSSNNFFTLSFSLCSLPFLIHILLPCSFIPYLLLLFIFAPFPVLLACSLLTICAYSSLPSLHLSLPPSLLAGGVKQGSKGFIYRPDLRVMFSIPQALRCLLVPSSLPSSLHFFLHSFTFTLSLRLYKLIFQSTFSPFYFSSLLFIPFTFTFHLFISKHP